MKKNNTTLKLAALAASGFALTGLSANAATTVWNVNMGNQDLTGYTGAATENTAGSTWNSVTADGTGIALVDSTNSGAAGVTLTISGTGFGTTGVTGDAIWQSWTKSSDNTTPFTMGLANLNTSATYDLILYSEWFWAAEGGMPVTQTLGSGLSSSITVNHSPGTNGDPIGALAEDTNPDDVDGAFNFYRISGLTADVAGNLEFSMGGVNGPFNGFQLVAIPEPSSTALLGLGALALILHRRK